MDYLLTHFKSRFSSSSPLGKLPYHAHCNNISIKKRSWAILLATREYACYYRFKGGTTMDEDSGIIAVNVLEGCQIVLSDVFAD